MDIHPRKKYAEEGNKNSGQNNIQNEMNQRSTLTHPNTPLSF